MNDRLEGPKWFTRRSYNERGVMTISIPSHSLFGPSAEETKELKIPGVSGAEMSSVPSGLCQSSIGYGVGRELIRAE